MPDKKTAFATAIFMILALAASIHAQESEIVKLPDPQITGGRPLMECLKARQSYRNFAPDKLSPQVLSNLLWAAFGINRPDSGKRTAPSAVNWQDIDIYVSTSDGLFLYLAKEHALKNILEEDIRGATGTQEFVKSVPLNLVYVSDYRKLARVSDEDKRLYSGAHTGFISQNVYLFSASEGLATVVRGLVDREAMAKTMKLRPDQRITFAQSVGYPKK